MSSVREDFGLVMRVALCTTSRSFFVAWSAFDRACFLNLTTSWNILASRTRAFQLSVQDRASNSKLGPHERLPFRPSFARGGRRQRIPRRSQQPLLKKRHLEDGTSGLASDKSGQAAAHSRLVPTHTKVRAPMRGKRGWASFFGTYPRAVVADHHSPAFAVHLGIG